jgi:transposase
MPLLFESRRMSTMPKKIDPELKARAVRLVSEHIGEYPSLTAASAVVAEQFGVGKESVRRSVVQGQFDGTVHIGVRRARSWPRSRLSRPRFAASRGTTRS